MTLQRDSTARARRRTYDDIRISRSADAVRDHHARAASAQAADGFRHKLLAANVERRRGLVQQKQRRIAQKSARDDQALPLPDAQVAERRAHFGFEPLGQLGDDFSGAAVSDCFLNVLRAFCKRMQQESGRTFASAPLPSHRVCRTSGYPASSKRTKSGGRSRR